MHRKKLASVLALGVHNLDQESKRVVLTDMGAGIEGGLKWEFGTNRCKLLYIGWVNSKVLRFRSCVHYRVITITKRARKECVCT